MGIFSSAAGMATAAYLMSFFSYMSTSLVKTSTPLGPYRRPLPRVLGEPRSFFPYRGTSLIRKWNPLGPYRRPVPRVLGGSQGGGRFLMGKVPL